ncbi:hypothetical protein H257_11374 [Aphanomyces astaci]|uniref:DDE Tnp4 domain-containing protein n=1 Tax=Aphanomyces astaci TaxID=112090 RepID=W4G575_APHAT|nr:hypothetical protein H257_11374 [Aphanomyces astaci]ETV74063.1 hypothetical protein H257_11374 [Aphanomyces astaci]|eukprot:XP_009836576.1 hypothetical protein H257_11374 [Aphanomyces astaci]
MDALLMTLTVLKHYNTWGKHTLDLGFKAPTFQKLILRVVEVGMPVFYAEFVKMPNMSELRAQFQSTERPTRRHDEAKPYFSAKHNLYGLKIEASVPPPQGLLVDMSESHCGAVADLTIMRSRIDQHVRALAKSDNELSILDHGEKKNPPRGFLDPDDVVRNRRVSSDRVVVEIFFGRVCSLWKVSYATFTWSAKFYDEIQHLMFALTNFRVSLMPLREADIHWYRRSVLARYESMVHATAAKREES